ncbi:hypothetical protein [Ancrocorticia populi]|uniref:hypothetical protein n=1 Tax=Ancrocorticia populi TaxID=2175228 RepID=UPI003F962190
MNTEAQFSIKYDGEDDTYHELDAALLSQALMGFSEMGRIAYRIAYPEETHSLNVKVHALESGSFGVTLEAVVPAIGHLYGQVVGLFNRDDVSALNTAYGMCGILASAFGLIKWIGGRKHKAERKGGETQITTKDGDTTTVPSVVYNIAGNATFIEAAGQALVPLDDPHYDRMDIRNSRGDSLDVTYEEDRGYFKTDSDELEYDQTLTIEVSIVTVQIASATKAWTFESGNQRFNAKVLDADFLRYVENVGYKFNRDSRALVDRREVRKRDSTGAMKSQYSIVKVHQVSSPGEEPKLF